MPGLPFLFRTKETSLFCVKKPPYGFHHVPYSDASTRRSGERKPTIPDRGNGWRKGSKDAGREADLKESGKRPGESHLYGNLSDRGIVPPSKLAEMDGGKSQRLGRAGQGRRRCRTGRRTSPLELAVGDRKQRA